MSDVEEETSLISVVHKSCKLVDTVDINEQLTYTTNTRNKISSVQVSQRRTFVLTGKFTNTGLMCLCMSVCVYVCLYCNSLLTIFLIISEIFKNLVVGYILKLTEGACNV